MGARQRAVSMGLFGVAMACAAACGAPPVEEESAVDSALAGVALRFDVVTLQCGDGQEACRADQDKCLCPAELDALDFGGRPHWIAMATDGQKSAIAARKNRLAGYVNSMNDGYAAGEKGEAAADDVAEALLAAYGGEMPKYVVLNEISKGAWRAEARYRQYVVDMLRTLRQRYDTTPIVASPYGLPATFANDQSWQYVVKWAYVAAEVELTGLEVKRAGFSVAAARKVYRDSIASYAAVKVPKSRLLLLDNFSSTTEKDTFGRAGVGHDDWVRAIHVRAEAAAPLGFAGYVSYAWAGNWLHDTSKDRIDYVRAYASHVLP